MAEVGCLRNGHFNNLQVDGNCIVYGETGNGEVKSGELTAMDLVKGISLKDLEDEVDNRDGSGHNPDDHFVAESDRADLDCTGINYFRWKNALIL